MNIMELRHISQAYDDLQILEDADFTLAAYEHIGLVGDNGSGKTTLVKIIMGEVGIRSGNRFIMEDLSIGYLKQVDEQKMPKGLDNAIHYETFSRIGFGHYKEIDERRLDHLSGGERTKYQLTSIFDHHYDLIILDEPTNHLDARGRDWLIERVKGYYGSMIIISHDRYFLDEVTERTVEVDDKKLKSYKGNYSAYKEQKNHERYTHEQAYSNQQRKKREIEQEVRLLRNWSEKGHRESTKKTIGGVKMGAKEKFRARAKKKDKQVKSKIKQLEKVDTSGVERPTDLPEIKFRFGEGSRNVRKTLSIEHVTKSFGDRILFEDAHFYVYKGDHIGLKGDNGSGKSTLINMIRGIDEKYEGDIYLNSSQRVGYVSQDVLDLNEDQTVLEVLDFYQKERITRGREVLAQMGIGSLKVNMKVSQLSMGERTRVKIAKLVLDEVDFLILDEPTNHLDLRTREMLEKALKNYDGTLLLCTHDRYMMEAICDRFVTIEDGKIEVI